VWHRPENQRLEGQVSISKRDIEEKERKPSKIWLRGLEGQFHPKDKIVQSAKGKVCAQRISRIKQ
jgi:hypothetical protein